MTEHFKPGDVVQLKSGGPDMTITRQNAFMGQIIEGEWCCQWFVSASLHSGVFKANALKLKIGSGTE